MYAGLTSSVLRADQYSGDPALRRVADGLRFPEGPVVLSDSTLFVVEIAGGTVLSFDPNGRRTVVAEVEGGPNGLAFGPDGALYLCNNGGVAWRQEDGYRRPAGQPPDYKGGRIQRIVPDTGEVSLLYDSCDGHPLRSPNDLVFDRFGGFYFTDMGKARARDRDHGGVYYATPDGRSIIEVAYGFLTPNGIGLSPDDSELYVAETETARLWAFEILSPGKVRKEPFPSPTGARLVAGLPGFRRFDSLAVDRDGNICVAAQFPGSIVAFRPDGTLVREVAMGDPFTTNICFGGADSAVAYVTRSSLGDVVATDWHTGGLRPHFSL
ncbi:MULTISPECIES: SMP-30/gluconolactonase/LRE family protein [Chelativorans]|jgi:gluconolactonase|uniref:Gluconolactonase n=1 Tax=Chelativorans sp. (strain BNC1) TaxID=266779 RepID=Q11BT7_CHESB|nr:MULTISPECIES: SMP-30/gluconolactonase/LRE family protein [Chelativorans]